MFDDVFLKGYAAKYSAPAPTAAAAAHQPHQPPPQPSKSKVTKHRVPEHLFDILNMVAMIRKVFA